MNTRTGLAAALAVVSALTVAGRGMTAEQEMSTAAVLERVGRYVESYEQAFAAMVCEERQVQKILRADGRVRKTRQLRSDYLLIKTGPAWAQVFRDVLEVDGKPIRNREDRLRTLFLESPRTAVEQARAIARESGRHNIGVSRVGNSPLLPLLFLHPRTAGRSRFQLAGDTLTFEEFQVPSLLRTDRGSLLARGSFVIDRVTGTVLTGDVSAIAPEGASSTAFSVRFAEDPQLKLMVPVDAREAYWPAHKPKEDRLEVESTYTNFRRFQVTVDEKIKTPE